MLCVYCKNKQKTGAIYPLCVKHAMDLSDKLEKLPSLSQYDLFVSYQNSEKEIERINNDLAEIYSQNITESVKKSFVYRKMCIVDMHIKIMKEIDRLCFGD